MTSPPRFALVTHGAFPHVDALARRVSAEGAHLDVVRLAAPEDAVGDPAALPVPARTSPAAALTLPILLARWAESPPLLVHVDDGLGAARVLAASRLVGVPVRIVSAWAAPAAHLRTGVAARAHERAAAWRARLVFGGASAVVAHGAAAAERVKALAPQVELHAFDPGLGLDTDALLVEGDESSRRDAARRAVAWTGPDALVVCPVATREGARAARALAETMRYRDASVGVAVVQVAGDPLDGAVRAPDDAGWARWCDAATVVALVDDADAVARAGGIAALRRRAVAARREGALRAAIVPDETGVALPEDVDAQAATVATLLRRPDERAMLASRARSWAARMLDRDVALERLLRIWTRHLAATRAETTTPT